MNRYLIRAKRVQEVEMFILASDEDEAHDIALSNPADWDVETTHDIEEVMVFDVTNERDYMEEL